jgi:hypothetical protein
MTNYHINTTTLPSLAAQEAKAASDAAKAQRKRVLEEVRKRRYEQEQERRKRQRNAYSTSEEYREHQERLKEEARLYR